MQPNPVGELQDRVARAMGRPVATGDIVYVVHPGPGVAGDVAEAGHSAQQGSGVCGYLAHVEVITPGHGRRAAAKTTEPKPSKREAKRAAAEVALADEELMSLLPSRLRTVVPTERQGRRVQADPQQQSRQAPRRATGGPRSPIQQLAPQLPGRVPEQQQDLPAPRAQGTVRSQLQEAAALVPLGGMPTEPEHGNPVGQLQELVQQSMRQAAACEGICYEVNEAPGGGFVATVTINSPEGPKTYTGSVGPSKREARRAAAETAIRDRLLRASLPPPSKRLIHRRPGIVMPDEQQLPELPANPVGELQERLQGVTRRPISRGDVIYTVEVDAQGRFVARVEVASLPEKPTILGPPCSSKSAARSAAAAVLLRDPALRAAMPFPPAFVAMGLAPPSQQEGAEAEAIRGPRRKLPMLNEVAGKPQVPVPPGHQGAASSIDEPGLARTAGA